MANMKQSKLKNFMAADDRGIKKGTDQKKKKKEKEKERNRPKKS